MQLSKDGYPAIQNHETLKQSINARDLHKFLAIGKDFSNWIKDQAKRADLVRDVDYVVFAEKGENQSGGRPSKEYCLTIEAGKNICMMSQSIKGKECRKYFIECERNLHVSQLPALPDFTNPVIAARAWADEVEKNMALEQSNQNKDNMLIASNEASIKAGEVLVEEFCKKYDHIDIGRNNMYEWLRLQGYLFENSRQPYQQFVARGLFTWKPTQEKHNGKIRHTLHITARGQVVLANKYMQWLEA